MNFQPHRQAFAAPIYTNSARFDGSARALTEDEIFKLAPSVFATTAHDSRSDKFRPIPTIEVLRGLVKEGFSVVGVRQGKTRIEGKAPFTKHLLRLRRLGDDVTYRAGDTVFEALLKNANDGTSAYDLDLAAFRISCLNSLVAKIASIDTVKVRHSGDVLNKVIEGTFRVVQAHEAVLAAPQDWSQIQLNRGDALAFAEAAHILRFADDEGNVTTAVEPKQLLTTRRQTDIGADLWTNFNVVQENVVKGGITSTGLDANGNRRRQTTRELGGIDQSVKLNKALWVLAQHFADHKKAA